MQNQNWSATISHEPTEFGGLNERNHWYLTTEMGSRRSTSSNTSDGLYVNDEDDIQVQKGNEIANFSHKPTEFGRLKARDFFKFHLS